MTPENMHAPRATSAAGQDNTASPPRLGGFSLARRILMAMSLVALVPLLIMAVQGLHCSRQAIVELEYRHLQSILAARKARMEAWLGERESDLRLMGLMACGHDRYTGLAGHMSADHLDTIGGTLDLFRIEKPLYESLGIYDANGRRIGRDTGSTHYDEGALLDPELRKRLKDATGIVASATHAHENEHIGLHMGYPLRPDGAGTVGYIAVNVNLADTLTGILEDRTGMGKAGRLYLLTAGGDYLTCPAPDARLIGHSADVPPGILQPEEHRVLTYQDATGATVLGTSARIPKFEWLLVAEISEAEALGWVAILGRRAVLTGVATFIVALVLASRFSRKLAEPMRALAETARRITGGSSRERVAEMHGLEAREVGLAFNEMLDALTQAQQRVVQSASLAAIGELSASVVHEMRNPLSSIKLNLQALGKKVEGDTNYSELADIAKEQTLRLEHMLTELLSFGKPLKLNAAATPFEALARDAIAGLKESAASKSIALRVQDGLGGRSLYVDREHLRRAIENLVKNAIDASPEESEVILRASVSADFDHSAAIGVLDHGPGVPPAMLAEIFKPFVTTREQGTGLGLANVKKIVEMHDGKATVQNLSEGGALFTLYVPLMIAEA